MSRIARLDAYGILQHMIVQGNEGRRIFNDVSIHENFVQHLAELSAIGLKWASCRREVSGGINRITIELVKGQGVAIEEVQARGVPTSVISRAIKRAGNKST